MTEPMRADAIVDGLVRRRAEVYVPASLRPLSVLELALPRRIRRILQRAFGSDRVAQAFDRAARAAYQETAGRPLQSRQIEIDRLLHHVLTPAWALLRDEPFGVEACPSLVL